MELAIHSAELRNQHHVYHITVSFRPAGTRWIATHRYSDFYELHSSGALPALLTFPPKLWFGSREEGTVAGRRVALEGWLRAVVERAGRYDEPLAQRSGPAVALLDDFLQADNQRLGAAPSLPIAEFGALLEGAPPAIAAAINAAQNLAVGRGSVAEVVSELTSLRTLVESQSVELDQMRRSLSQPNSPARLPKPAREAAVASRVDPIDEARTQEHLAAHATDLGGIAQAPGLKQHLEKHQSRLRTGKGPRIGILGSTRGTNTLHIYEEIAAGRFNAEVAVVVSNISKAVILERARAAGVPAVHIAAKGRSREEFDAEVNSVLEAHGVELVLLVGFMRILSPVFCNAWKGRAVNVHPSLLPKHAALMDLAVHQSVLDAGDKESGCTVHMVDEVVDAGSIVVQPSVAVDSSDTAESLKAKVQALEAPALVEAVKIFSQNGNKFPVAAASNASDGRANSSEQQVATEVLALSALQTRQGYQQQNDPWNKTDK